MQVAKWGNSLAVRLPAAVVEALDLKEGDQIEIRITGKREFEVIRDRTKEKALARLRKLRRPSPAPLTTDTHDAGLRIAAKYGFPFYDALIAAAALEAECTTLYSEDFQDGQVIEGRLTVRNPFA